MRKNYEENKQQVEKIVAGGQISSPPSSSSGGDSGSGKGNWTSWALEGLTKSMEKVTNEDISAKLESSDHVQKKSDESVQLSDGAGEGTHATGAIHSISPREITTSIGWGDDDDIDLDDSLDNEKESSRVPESISRECAIKPERRPPAPKKSRKDTKAVTVKKMTVNPNEKDAWDDF